MHITNKENNMYFEQAGNLKQFLCPDFKTGVILTDTVSSRIIFMGLGKKDFAFCGIY